MSTGKGSGRGAVRAPATPSGGVRESNPARPCSAPPILVVDDDREATSMVRRFPEQHGYRVVVVDGPRSAMDRCLDVRPGLVLLDPMMPHVDEEGLVRRLRGVLRERTPAVALVSASPMRTEVRKRLGLPEGPSRPFALDDPLALVAQLAGAPEPRSG
jgi:PleD family two-component response regulator